MSRDHYVARTYLKHFTDDRSRLHAHRKADGAYFPCHPGDVCSEWDGDLNPNFLPHRPTLLGDLRRVFEPQWDFLVSELAERRFSDGHKFALSGFLSNLMTNTPTWRRIVKRIHEHQSESNVRFTNQMKVKHNEPNDDLAEAIRFLDEGRITVDADPDGVKARLTRRMLNVAWMIYHHKWRFLENRSSHPFLTSDNPALMAPQKAGSTLRFLPITPKLCLGFEFKPNLAPPAGKNGEGIDFRIASRGATSFAVAPSGMVKEINRLVVQCAENLVFSNSLAPGIAAVVRRNSHIGLDVRLRRKIHEEENRMLVGFEVCLRPRSEIKT